MPYGSGYYGSGFYGTGTSYGGGSVTRPTVSQAAEDLYLILKPVAYDDEARDWALLIFCEAWAGPLQIVYDLSINSWKDILNIDSIPDEALAWLAQFVGAQIPLAPVSPPDPDYWDKVREYIRDNPEFRIGSPIAIVTAAQQYLTGEKTVILRERNGSPYKLEVRTRTNETPNSNLVLSAILAHKPGGIILDYATVTGQDYQEIYTNFATYQTVYTTYLTYQGVFTNTPGT